VLVEAPAAAAVVVDLLRERWRAEGSPSARKAAATAVSTAPCPKKSVKGRVAIWCLLPTRGGTWV